MLFAKDKVEELCPAYVYNFNLNNERLTLTASQAIENPIRALCIAPMRRYLYTYHVEKKKLALTPFCDDVNFSLVFVKFTLTCNLHATYFRTLGLFFKNQSCG